MTGQRFGRLVVVERCGTMYKKPISAWLCRCDCGNEKIVPIFHLKNGNTKSCGCLTKEMASERGHKSKIGERSRKHGDFGTKLYGVWAAMKRRCSNPNVPAYKNYGGRGITVCNDWMAYQSFKDWAIGTGYKESTGEARNKLTLERIDANGPYSPDNCTWIPLKQQAGNHRRNVKIEHDGEMLTLSEISRKTGIKPGTISKRHRQGATSYQELTVPTEKNN